MLGVVKDRKRHAALPPFLEDEGLMCRDGVEVYVTDARSEAGLLSTPPLVSDDDAGR